MEGIIAQTAYGVVEEFFKTIEKVGLSDVGRTCEEICKVVKEGSLEIVSAAISEMDNAVLAAKKERKLDGLTVKVGSGSGSNYKYLTNDGTAGPAATGSGGAHTHAVTLSGSTGSKCSGTAHSNMQPYITCFFYKRTA